MCIRDSPITGNYRFILSNDVTVTYIAIHVDGPIIVATSQLHLDSIIPATSLLPRYCSTDAITPLTYHFRSLRYQRYHYVTTRTYYEGSYRTIHQSLPPMVHDHANYIPGHTPSLLYADYTQIFQRIIGRAIYIFHSQPAILYAIKQPAKANQI